MNSSTLPADRENELGWLVDPREPEAHLQVLARPEFVVPVIGSGVSVPAGYPTGDSLATELIRLGRAGGLDDEELRSSDPRPLADLLIGRRAIERDELLRRVGEIYDRDPTGNSDTIDALLRVESRRVVTLNYDRSLEARAAELGVECETLVLAKDGARVLEVLGADAARDKLVVVHAHGVARDPQTIVLDGEGYRELMAAPYVGDCIRLLILNSRLIFMGTQLDELHFLQELIRLRLGHKRHLLVASDQTASDLLHAERSPLTPDRYLVLVRGYADHADLAPLVDLLGPPTDEPVAPPSGPMFSVVSLQPPADYVETLMVEKREAEDDFEASYLVALGTRSPVEIEQVAAVGTRTLIEGLPGAGKSTLLLEVGLRQSQQVVPLLLQAPRLELVGDPRLLLAKWLEVAAALHPEEIHDQGRLDNEVFHFLIDGLDEIPYPQQGHAVAQIIEVTAENPVHSFTVASRTIPAIEDFARPEWVRVVLAPTPEWRQAYLEKRGISWDQLVDATPLLADLSGLLDLPFFLSQTVDLYEQGALVDEADLLSLVGRFVDSALGGIDETMPSSAVRPWLRRLALAMLLAGRSELTVDEIADSLPTDLQNYGDAVAVAERFVSARVLRAIGGREYGFVHRIFGEALAAEALMELDPYESGVLDVAAPAVTPRIRGLRTDWLVPITLVAARSEKWRQALAERDPLAAARAVPSDASVEERERVARHIWDTYVGWRIWMSDYQRMTIVEDKSVLARLLATDGLEELHAEICAAVSSDVREISGNGSPFSQRWATGRLNPSLVTSSNPAMTTSYVASRRSQHATLNSAASSTSSPTEPSMQRMRPRHRT